MKSPFREQSLGHYASASHNLEIPMEPFKIFTAPKVKLWSAWTEIYHTLRNGNISAKPPSLKKSMANNNVKELF